MAEQSKELTVDQLNVIGQHWDTDEKRYVKKLQRVYNSTVDFKNRDTDCLCTRARRKVWMKWFRGWALKNGYYEYE